MRRGKNKSYVCVRVDGHNPSTMRWIDRIYNYLKIPASPRVVAKWFALERRRAGYKATATNHRRVLQNYYEKMIALGLITWIHGTHGTRFSGVIRRKK